MTISSSSRACLESTLGNVQVTTRLVVAACPALYWTLATLLERSPPAWSRLARLAFVGVYGLWRRQRRACFDEGTLGILGTRGKVHLFAGIKKSGIFFRYRTS